jgi:hypothetical protein
MCVTGAKLVAGRFVIAGLVPAISIRRAQCADYRDGRDKPGHDQIGTATSFAPLTNVGAKLLPYFAIPVFGAVSARRFHSTPNTIRPAPEKT